MMGRKNAFPLLNCGAISGANKIRGLPLYKAKPLIFTEREKGFEPSTLSLGS